MKMKPVDVKSSPCINSSKETNEEDSKIKIDDIVRISKYKNIFAKGYVPNWSFEVLLVYIFNSNYLRSNHLSSLVGRNLNIA